MSSITKLSAKKLVKDIRQKKITSRVLVEESLNNIERLDDMLKAFVTVDAEGALAAADNCDRFSELSNLGPLHGVPVAIKDVTDTAGLRTTSGSLLKRNMVPRVDELSVSRLRAAGAIIIGKTNTPEFAFGAVCTNQLRGPTANPWDTRLTSGGSSGGSAVAVTVGMVPLAQGTDFGGSVRTPASFCGCVGLRPTPGVIPEPSRPLAWSSLATQGVLARSVDDAELMLNVMAGPHRDDPTSRNVTWIEETETSLRVAVSPTLNGAFSVDPPVRKAFSHAVNSASTVFECVEEAAPQVEGASEAFKTLRAAESWLKFGEMVNANEHELTESFVWNVRRGSTITAENYLRAEIVRSQTYRSFQAFFDHYDILMLPAASVLPFPNEQAEVWEIDGKKCETIIDYLACTYLISLIGFPSIALPALWTKEGIPFGIQLVARPNNENTLLRAARALEQKGFCHRWPAINGYDNKV